MEKVFVSSVMNGFSAERAAAREAIESLALRPLMAELSPASAHASKHALLPLVDEADAVVLILGARYGFEAASGRSPTHDEYDRAVQAGIPVLAFATGDNDSREPKQRLFVEEVGGGWEDGRFLSFFETPQQLLSRVVAGLNQLRTDTAHQAAHPQAQRQAAELSVSQTFRWFSKMNRARVVFVPVGSVTHIDALVLDDSAFANRVAGSLRNSGLATQSQPLEIEPKSSGVTVRATGPQDHQIELQLMKDGTVSVEASVGGTGSMGSMVLSYPRIQVLIDAASSLAQELWTLLPTDGRISQVAVAVGIPEGGLSPLSISGSTGGSLAMLFNDAGQVSAPDPPVILDRRQLGSASSTRLLAASIKQVFADRNGLRD